MTRYTSLFIFILLAFITVSGLSCKSEVKKAIEPPKPAELFNRYKESVVLIKTSFYARLVLDNGLTLYFSNPDNQEGDPFTEDENEARQNPLTIFGTGFFLTRDGVIATNRHVAYPILEDLDVLGMLKQRYDALKSFIIHEIEINNDTLNMIDNALNQNPTESQIDILKEKAEEIVNRNIFYRIYLASNDFDPKQSSLEIIPVKVEIAYNNSFADENSGYSACNILGKSEDKEIDLAILQLKDRHTPRKVTTLFDFENHDPNIENGTADSTDTYDLNNSLEINKKLYMIGYNHGLTVATTSDGLKAQFTQGSVSQESDKYRVLYSIPALQGSSGSPIIDRWGNLVAVNFAMVAGTQSFNYGIMAKHLKNLLHYYHNGNSTHSFDFGTTSLESQNNQNVAVSNDENSRPDFRTIIHNFLIAEDKRDFSTIYPFFSNNIRRYWDMTNPTETDLRTRYGKLWRKSIHSQNNITKIEKINFYTYDVSTHFSFTDIDNNYKEVYATFRIVFDDTGKITEIFGK
ncbi:MAG: serine protease [Saprospiraceae bacterium]